MSHLNTVLRAVPNKRLQQAARYYSQHGSLNLFSTAVRVLLQRVFGPDINGYLDRKSLDREEMLESVPADRIWYYDSPEVVEREVPIHFGTLPDSFAAYSRPLHREQPYVCEVENVTLAGPTANPKTRDGKYVREAQSLSRGQLLTTIIMEALSDPLGCNDQPADRIETGVVFTNLWATNHYHWQIDFLPRLRGVDAYVRERGSRPTLILGSDPPKWQLNYLALLGYGPEDYHVYDGHRLEVDTLVVPYGTRFKRAQIEWVANRLAESLPFDSDPVPTKIYISRDDALCRRVLNEDELIATLSDRGFTRVELSKISIEDQIRMFSQAETVVGPQGAGFANLMFADDASVIELFGAKEGLSTFNLARILDHEYACLRCETNGEDLIADVSQVTEMLDTVKERTAANST
jgi:hypothetical protein